LIKSAAETSHVEHVKDQRSQADGNRLMAESPRRRDRPEELRDALDGRVVAQTEGLISLPDLPD
jgi:hypothetical protein